MTDKELEQIVGNMLRTGVILAALIVLAGGIVYLLHHGNEAPQHSVFKGQPPAYSTLTGVFSTHTIEGGRGIIMIGLLVLILTPIARVAFALFAFYLERDWTYVIVTAIVLGLLTYSLFSA